MALAVSGALWKMIWTKLKSWETISAYSMKLACNFAITFLSSGSSSSSSSLPFCPFSPLLAVVILSRYRTLAYLAASIFR